jgi:ABC-2 type transport system ATP-binding protein
MNQETPAVEIRGLTKYYKLEWRRGSVIALENLNLTVNAGEIFGLLGPNGSGKSTTMKLMLGLARPSAGEVKIFGHAAGSMAARRAVGFLPENPYFPTFLNGREILRYYGRLSGLSGRALEERSKELIALVRLERGADRPLRTYSKGMLQRIGLAQALLHDPQLLLLDEPTAGVDPVGSREMRDLMLELRDRGKTVIFSSHLLEQVQEVADQVAILHLGCKMREGSLDDLLSLEGELEVQAKGGNPELEAELRRLLEKHGAREVRISRPRLKLEDYFIRTITGQQEGKAGS